MLKISAYMQEPNSNEWESLFELRDVSPAVTSVVEILADPPPELLSGFHVVTVPVTDMTFPLPADKSKIRVYLTDYPEPRRLLELPGDESECGFLEFEVRGVASGAESEYLPEAYKRLFNR
jgi:hypothetical protein